MCGGEAEGWGKLLCQRCANKSTRFDRPLCLDCRLMLDDFGRCPQCETDKPFPLFVLGEYEPPLKDIIHRFKYDGFEKLGMFLSDRLFSLYEKPLREMKIDLLVPVPLGSIRKKLRGFNQAGIMSDIISGRLGLQSAENGVAKARRTKDQTRLNPARRLLNIKGAFKAGSVDLKGKRIAVIDDVVTTGATINELRRVIEEDGGGTVVCAMAAASSRD